MATAIVDSLITKFILDPTAYQKGAAQVQSTTAVLGQSMKKVAGFTPPIVADLKNAEKAGSNFASILEEGVTEGLNMVGSAVSSVLTGLGAIAISAVAAGAALVGLGAYAVKAFADYQQMQLTFTGIFQDANKSQQMMTALSQYSLKSALDEDGLRQAALALTQAKLSVQQFLPVLEILSAKGGKFNTEGIIEAADVLRRIRGGQIAEGLGPEGLGRFGINREDIEKAGGKFDKGGQFLGTWRDALNIIKQIAGESKGVLDAMEGSDSAKIGNAWEAVQKAIRDSGQVLAGIFLPAIEKATDFVAWLANNNVFGTIASNWAGLFGLANGTNTDGILYMVATLVATLEGLPEVIRRIGSASVMVIQTLWGVVSGVIGKMLTVLSSLPGIGILFKGMEGLLKVASTELTSLFNQVGPALSEAYGLTDIARNRDSLLAAFGQQGTPSPVSFPETQGDGSDDNQSTIAQNTAKLVELQERQVQISEQMLGGGAVGRGAVSAANLGKSFGDAPLAGHGSWDRVTRAIRDAVHEAMSGQLEVAGQSRGFGTQR